MRLASPDAIYSKEVGFGWVKARTFLSNYVLLKTWTTLIWRVTSDSAELS
jgi:hypothetical protein